MNATKKGYDITLEMLYKTLCLKRKKLVITFTTAILTKHYNTFTSKA